MNNARRHNDTLPLLLAVIVTAGLAARWLSWPGFATHDTLFITREAIAGEYTTYHPLLNALLIRWLAVPLDSFWLYTSLQIVYCCAVLYRSFQLVLYRQTNPGLGLLAVLVWALSLHTLLYLGIIWKDVLIAYGLTYLAALFYRLRSQSDFVPTRRDAMLFTLAMFLCLGLRHGMVFNLVLVPLLMGWRNVVRSRRLWLPLALATAGFVGVQALSASQWVRNDSAHYTKLKISAVSQPFLAIVTNKNGYTSDDYDYDRRLAVETFGPRFAEEFTPDYFRNNVVDAGQEKLDAVYRAVLKRSPRLCAMNFSICISSRIQMFLGTLQPSTSFGGMTFYDLGTFDQCDKVFGMSPPQCQVLTEFETSEKLSGALSLQRSLQARWVDSKHPFVKLVFWNLLPALCFMVALLIFGRAFTPAWWVAIFFAVQVVLPFLTSMANDFRYYYFLFPFLIVFAPAILDAALVKLAAQGRARNVSSSSARERGGKP